MALAPRHGNLGLPGWQLISANTQAGVEGYFRREWILAVSRTLEMADDQAFLLRCTKIRGGVRFCARWDWRIERNALLRSRAVAMYVNVECVTAFGDATVWLVVAHRSQYLASQYNPELPIEIAESWRWVRGATESDTPDSQWCSVRRTLRLT